MFPNKKNGFLAKIRARCIINQRQINVSLAKTIPIKHGIIISGGVCQVWGPSRSEAAINEAAINVWQQSKLGKVNEWSMCTTWKMAELILTTTSWDTGTHRHEIIVAFVCCVNCPELEWWDFSKLEWLLWHCNIQLRENLRSGCPLPHL